MKSTRIQSRFLVAPLAGHAAAACAHVAGPFERRDRFSFERIGWTKSTRLVPDVEDVFRAPTWSEWNALHGDAYPLDDIERFVETSHGHVECPDRAMIEYSGTALRYAGPVKVSLPFLERLSRFENLVDEVAIEVYGRPPRRLRHLGAFSCRASRTRSYRLSEHALGNAIDIAGFDFGPASKEQVLPAGLPRQLGGAFQVRVAKHWAADIFRVALGPSHRGHHDHLHFDVSPWRYVDL